MTTPNSLPLEETTSDTPRTDANLRGWDIPAPFAEFTRQLERELAEAKKPPPCLHTQQHGWIKGDRSEMYCSDCGKQMTPQVLVAGVFPGAICEGWHRLGQAGCLHEWRGPGEMPRRYTCGCGTVVFRSHADAD